MKKSVFVLLIALIAPIFLLVGCGEVASFNITATVNCQNGNVTGMGKYDEGSKVTLTARGVNGKKFIAWVYQNKTLLDGNNAYEITTSDDKLSSTITFTVSAHTSDNYTAVFEDSKQAYYTLSSYRVVRYEEGEDVPAEDLNDQHTTCIGDLRVRVGENELEYRHILELTSENFLNTTTRFSNVKSVLVLTKPHYFNFVFTTDDFSVNKTVVLTYGESNEQDGVKVDFVKSDDNSINGNIVLSYTYIPETEEVEEGQEPKQLTTIFLTISPLR